MLWPGGSRHKSRSGAHEVTQALPGKLRNKVAGGRQGAPEPGKRGKVFSEPRVLPCASLSPVTFWIQPACLLRLSLAGSWQALRPLAPVLTVTCRGLRTLTWPAAGALSTPREQRDLGWAARMWLSRPWPGGDSSDRRGLVLGAAGGEGGGARTSAPGLA